MSFAVSTFVCLCVSNPSLEEPDCAGGPFSPWLSCALDDVLLPLGSLVAYQLYPRSPFEVFLSSKEGSACVGLPSTLPLSAVDVVVLAVLQCFAKVLDVIRKVL